MLCQTVVAKGSHCLQVHSQVVATQQLKYLFYQVLKAAHTDFKGYSVGTDKEIGANQIFEANKDLKFLDALLAEQGFMIQCSHPSDGKV